VATDDFRYLDPGFYDDVGTVELQLGGGVVKEAGKWRLSLKNSLGGGLAYNRSGLAASGRPELDPFYLRGFIEGVAKRALGAKLTLGARAYLGGATGDHPVAKQRQIYFQGSDPLTQLFNPFLRSRGALLVRPDFDYHSPGGGGVRGADPHLASDGVVALNLELEHTLLTQPTAHLFRRMSAALFTDLSHGIGGSEAPANGRIRFLGDAGIGLRATHRIGDTEFTTRFDFPLYMSRPEVAQDRSPGDGKFEFRWVFSFEPEF
jgi:hypothetical protein